LLKHVDVLRAEKEELNKQLDETTEASQAEQDVT